MGAIHKPRKFQFREIQNREIQEVAVPQKSKIDKVLLSFWANTRSTFL